MENASQSSDVSSKRRLKTPMHLLQDGGVYFLGSKIRIISKAKCRYVVVLVVMVVMVIMVTMVIMVAMVIMVIMVTNIITVKWSSWSPWTSWSWLSLS